MKALVGNKIVSEKEFAQAEQIYENARISYEAVAKNHSASGQAVVSPISGYVKNLLVKEGDYVSVGQRHPEPQAFPACGCIRKVLSLPKQHRFCQLLYSL